MCHSVTGTVPVYTVPPVTVPVFYVSVSHSTVFRAGKIALPTAPNLPVQSWNFGPLGNYLVCTHPYSSLLQWAFALSTGLMYRGEGLLKSPPPPQNTAAGRTRSQRLLRPVCSDTPVSADV